MVDCLKNNFFFFPALLLALLLYSGLLEVRRERPYSSLVPLEEALALEGRVLSSPSVLQGSSKFCKIKFKVEGSASKSGLVSRSDGTLDLLVPLSLYEMHRPGRLYSAWRGRKVDLLLDQGARLSVSGAPFVWRGGPVFKCSEISFCGYAPGIWGRLQRARALSRLQFSRLLFAWGSAGGLLLALLSGSRDYLSKEAADAFRLAGLSHVLALSGMHLSLIGGLAGSLGKKSFGKRAALALEFFSILLFVWFAGKSPSLFRALLCSLASLLAALLKLKAKSGLNVLCFVFIVHASLFPADVFELSFMLSYGALFGILLFDQIISRALHHFLPGGAGSSLGASTAAQAFTMPISLKCFGIFSPGGILASAALSPLITLFVYSGLLFVLLSLAFPFLAPVCGSLLGLLDKAIKSAVLFFAALPHVRI